MSGQYRILRKDGIMNKREFLEALRNRLTGEVDASVVEDNIRYYRQYIDQEVAAGKTEEEVLGMLGDPNMLAKTIIDTNDGKESGGTYAESSSAYEYSKRETSTHTTHSMNIPGWVFAIFIALVIFVLGALFLRLLPFIIVGAAVLYFIRKMKR
jgi:uncharacterized membrane protein